MLGNDVREGRIVLGALAAACLAAFLATIPLPRVDGVLLGTDGVGYYAYLPSVAIDHDVDFTNQFASLDPLRVRSEVPLTPTGLPANFWPVGPAILWLPFFLLAHGLALAFDALGASIRLDGAGYWHQAFAISANILYGGVALLLAYEVARRVGSGRAGGDHCGAGGPATCLWSTLTVALAGNLAYYMTAEPSMAHPVSAFAVCAFYLAWLRLRGRQGLGRAAALGALLGIIALVRLQDVALILVPLGEDLWVALRPGQTGRGVLRAWLVDTLLMWTVALAVYSPQFAVNQALFGSWWRPPQLYAGFAGASQFDWRSPHLLDVLVSARRGLFVWHPVYALCLLGAVPLWKRDRTLALALVVGAASQAYILGGWFDWWQGRAFGGRAFIGCFPLFVAGLASLADAARRALSSRPSLRLALPAACLLLLAANGLLAIEYRFDLAYVERPATWRDLGPRRVTFLLDHLPGRHAPRIPTSR